MQRATKLNTSYIVPAVILLGVVAAVIIALAVGEKKPAKPSAPKNTVVQSACGPYRKDGVVVIDGQDINVEVVKDQNELQKGLAGRTCILPDQGMLFAFTKPGQYPIWMKGMKFPIDIVWITADRKVAAIEVDESPSTYPDRFANKIPAQYVLELKANRSQELHMKIGSSVQFKNT
ncbi:MAG TPA: DUF192 domain-containing protein [Candidatus Saccharimonadales bacterium]|nr:DUF192 domain-containing protein [Candidatus Saccharimonadales bacterium]